jgi:phospholipase/carboxylesterase
VSLQLRHQQYGSLQCVVVESGVRPTIPVILCHGYGAPGNDLVSLVEPLADWLEDSIERFSFVFPAAPLAPRDMSMYGGRAWWAINMAALLAASETGKFSELHDVEPPGMADATSALVTCVSAVLEDAGPSRPYVLGGFSQGAMVTMNASLRSTLPPPKLLVQLSGTVVCRPKWQIALASGRLSDTFVLQSHGRQDTILPFQSAEVLRDLLVAADVDQQFVAFDGPHAIPMEPLMQLAIRLKRLAQAH